MGPATCGQPQLSDAESVLRFDDKKGSLAIYRETCSILLIDKYWK
jgi:hypothetical protein